MAAYAIERCVFGNPVSPLTLGLSAIVGLLPDLDGLVAMAVKRQRLNQQKLCHHQYWSHTPLFYVGLTVLVGALFSWRAMVLFGALTLLHLLLDSWSTDDGIMWLWPFSRQQFALFPRNLHAGGVHGIDFYRRHIRCARIIVPEITLLVGGAFLALYTLGSA